VTFKGRLIFFLATTIGPAIAAGFHSVEKQGKAEQYTDYGSAAGCT